MNSIFRLIRKSFSNYIGTFDINVFLFYIDFDSDCYKSNYQTETKEPIPNNHKLLKVLTVCICV